MVWSILPTSDARISSFLDDLRKSVPPRIAEQRLEIACEPELDPVAVHPRFAIETSDQPIDASIIVAPHRHISHNPAHPNTEHLGNIIPSRHKDKAFLPPPSAKF